MQRRNDIRLALLLGERGDVVEPSASMGVLLGIWGCLYLSEGGGISGACLIPIDNKKYDKHHFQVIYQITHT